MKGLPSLPPGFPPLPPGTVRIERFDWTSVDKRTEVRFAVSAMLIAMAEGYLPFETITTKLDPQFYHTWIKPYRFDHHSTHVMQEMDRERLHDPVLGVYMPDRSVLLIDGCHRYGALIERGFQYVDYKIVALADWPPYARIYGKWPPD